MAESEAGRGPFSIANSHVVADQTAVFAFLGDPGTHGLSEPVKRIDTHGAAVFLAGRNVYKVKRAVCFAYMDFSSLAKRKAACEAELAINRATAPAIYLDVVSITQKGDRLQLGGDGEIVEWAVHMRRFYENATLDHVIEKGPLGAALVEQLAQAIVTAHRLAQRQPDGRFATTSLRSAVVETVDELRSCADIVSPSLIEKLWSKLTEALECAEEQLLNRGGHGKVRRCHGDLHLRNIALIAGKPVLFDALEFDEALATTDILYDLGFLIMDLCTRNLDGDANQLLNHYLWSCEDEHGEVEGLALLPFFLSLRAAIRSKVAVAQARQFPVALGIVTEAQSYCGAALRFLDPVAPCLVAIGGLSGTGKSTLAAKLAPSFGAAPGALHLRSDVERKRLFSVGVTEQLPTKAYDFDTTALVYKNLRILAGTALGGGRSVIVDATYQKWSERKEIGNLALRMSVPFIGLWLDAPIEIRNGRVAERQGDASDATAAVVIAQARDDTGPIEWHRLDATAPIEALTAAARSLVKSL